ncbi:hypothetical protein WDU94_013749 [Cyamophila willieti]
MCLCCWARLRNFIADYLSHCHNYTLLNWLSDLFKLFIILNYIYFAYMIFAKLWIILNKYFEEKCRCRVVQKRSRSCESSRSQQDCRRPPQSCGQGEVGPKSCTCYKPPVGQYLPPQDSTSRCSSPGTLERIRNSVCTLFSKPQSPPSCSPCETKRSCEKKRSCENRPSSCEKRGIECPSSIERIQVEFNCKTKKPRKTRDGKMPKSRSCTKCAIQHTIAGMSSVASVSNGGASEEVEIEEA